MSDILHSGEAAALRGDAPRLGVEVPTQWTRHFPPQTRLGPGLRAAVTITHGPDSQAARRHSPARGRAPPGPRFPVNIQYIRGSVWTSLSSRPPAPGVLPLSSVAHSPCPVLPPSPRSPPPPTSSFLDQDGLYLSWQRNRKARGRGI